MNEREYMRKQDNKGNVSKWDRDIHEWILRDKDRNYEWNKYRNKLRTRIIDDVKWLKR